MLCRYLAEVLQEVLHLSRQDERLTITLEAELSLAMAKEVAKVDVEELAGLVLEHEVAGMAITNA